MNIFLNEYFGFCFELNFELNHFSARFNEKMNFQNVSYRASLDSVWGFLNLSLRASGAQLGFDIVDCMWVQFRMGSLGLTIWGGYILGEYIFLVQKRHFTNMGPQLTSFGAKT